MVGGIFAVEDEAFFGPTESGKGANVHGAVAQGKTALGRVLNVCISSVSSFCLLAKR